MKSLLFALALALLAPAASLAASESKLVIGGVAIGSSSAHYLRFTKHLVVSPKRRSHPAFKGADVHAIRRLESPLRRQIFDAMSRSQSDAFRFSTLRKAQENFDMRVCAVGFMFLVQKGKHGGGVDFDYAGSTVPEAADPAHWEAASRFTHVSRKGTSASASIDGIVRDRFRGECLGAMQVNVLHAARRALGAARFDRLHADGLDIGPRTAAAAAHTREAKSLAVGDMVPGDWVYMKNKDDYGTDLRPGVAAGYWSGENAMYLGKFEVGPDRKPHFGANATRRYSGMGAYAKSEGELRAMLKKAYLNEMRPPRTRISHSITDADIRWFRVDRLVTGG